MVLVSNIMVTVCIMFSVPILHYPCRYSLWSLLHLMFPKGTVFYYYIQWKTIIDIAKSFSYYHNLVKVIPEPFDNGQPSTFNRKWFSILAVVLHVGIYILVITSSDFKIVMALGGAISGSCIIQIFPAMYYLKIFDWAHNGIYNKCVWFILILECG